MVVERMNELSIMVERVALPCVLVVWCTAWTNSVYSSCHQRGSVLLLGGAMSSSMLWGDSEIECLLEELDDGSFDDDEHLFSVKTLVAIFHIVVALTHNEYTRGWLSVGENTQGKYMEGGVYYYYDFYYFVREWIVRCTR
jgi:hypothetical protein